MMAIGSKMIEVVKLSPLGLTVCHTKDLTKMISGMGMGSWYGPMGICTREGGRMGGDGGLEFLPVMARRPNNAGKRNRKPNTPNS